jgi:hypothetical protein
MNEFQIRLSVIQSKPVRGPGAVFGQRMPDKLLDASFTTDNVQNIRSIVDGLLFEAIPDTQRPEEKEEDIKTAGGRWIFVPSDTKSEELNRPLPPTVDESGDLDTASRLPLAECEHPERCDIHEHEYGGREGPSDFPIVTTAAEDGLPAGGKHSGNCSCRACEPILPGEVATIQVPSSFITPRRVRDDPQA